MGVPVPAYSRIARKSTWLAHAEENQLAKDLDAMVRAIEQQAQLVQHIPAQEGFI